MDGTEHHAQDGRTVDTRSTTVGSATRLGATGPFPAVARPTFVLSGGGNLGAIQVGMLRAVTEAGIEPGLIVGSSIGAINGAFLAGHPGPDGVADIGRLWSSLRRRDVLGVHPRTLVRGLAGRQGYIFDAEPLRALLDSFVGFPLLEQSPVPLAVVATDLGSGEPVLLRSGDVTTALLASSAVPGLLPPVCVGGRLLVDGAVASDVPLCEAVTLGSTEVIVLATTATQIEDLRLRRPRRTYRCVDESLQVKVVPPLEVTVPFAALDQSGRLAELGYRRARQWLDEGMPQASTARCASPRSDTDLDASSERVPVRTRHASSTRCPACTRRARRYPSPWSRATP